LDRETTGAYLRLSWDPNQQGVLQGELHQYDTQSSQWVSDSLPLQVIGGTPSDFLCWVQVKGDFTSGFVVSIRGKANNGVMKNGTIKTLGGYYFENSSGHMKAGKITISGTLVPEAKVPVPK